MVPPNAYASEANSEDDYTRAQDRLVEALQWSEKRPVEAVPEAETYAGILLQQSLTRYYLSGDKKGNEVAENHLRKVRELVSKWPDSWRLKSVVIRLEYYLIYNVPNNRQAMLGLAERLIPIIDKSAWNFNAVFWHFRLRKDAYQGEGNFERSPADYSSEKTLIIWFREHLIQGHAYTLVQLEAAAMQFQDVLELIQTQFSQTNDKKTADDRRAILNELETTMKAIETRLPKSMVVYATRGDLLRLQEMSVADGINTRSADELRAATQKHRMVAAALGVGSSVADSLAPAFKSYTDENADQASKASALATLENTMQDVFSLDLTGADTVLQNDDIRLSGEILENLEDEDPAYLIYDQMVSHYFQLYSRASRDSKLVFLATVVRLSDMRIRKWYEAGENDKVAEFWSNYYADLSIKTFSSGGDRDALITQLSLCAASLLRTGRVEEGQHLLDDTFALCERIMMERPWDFWVRTHMAWLCFAAAKVLKDRDDPKKAQEWLRRGWNVRKELVGSNIDLSRYSVLPLKGDVPENIPEADASFFAQLKPSENGGNEDGKKFTIDVNDNGQRYPWQIYVLPGKNGYQRLLDQFRLLSEDRGGTAPKEIREIFDRIHKSSDDKKIDFLDLCTKEFPKAALEIAEKQLQTVRAVFNDQHDKKATPEAIAVREQDLSAAFDTACRSAMDCSDWKKLGDYAKEWLQRNSKNASAQSRLAIASFAQSRVSEALSIYERLWDEPEDNGRFRKVASADIESITDSEGMIGSLGRLYLKAKEDNVSFPELIKDEFEGQLRAEQLDGAVKQLKEADDAYLKDKSDPNRLKLAQAYNTAADRALFRERWTDAENWARKSIEFSNSSNAFAQGNLATALLFQGKYEQALEIYRAHWLDPANGETLGDSALADFEALEKAGIKHPDVARIKAALGTKKATPAASKHKPKAESKP
jgi:hypothetical protein